MKLIIVALTLLIALPGYAQTQTIQTTATVNVHDLGCVTPAGSGDPALRVYTQLGNSIDSIILGSADGAIELNHVIAYGNGCDLNKLDQINAHSAGSFGFIYDVPVTITKVSSPFQNGAGACKTDFVETLAITLAPGIVVTSTANVQRVGTSCP